MTSAHAKWDRGSRTRCLKTVRATEFDGELHVTPAPSDVTS